MNKNIYLIRHGEAQHNINYLKYGSKTFYDINFIDTKLTPNGHKQSSDLNKLWKNINDIEIVLVSPLYRTLETATNIFKNYNIPIISLEDLREFPNTKHTCNKRSDKSILLKNFSHINFDNIQYEKDNIWNDNIEENITSLNIRIENIKNYIKNLNYNNICIVGHSSFIGQMIFNKIALLDNGDEELKHCFPYKINL